MSKLSMAVAFTIAVISMLLIPTISPTGIRLANASSCSVSGSSQGTSTSSSSSSSSCACSVMASHGMVVVSGNCKPPGCPPGMNGTPSIEDSEAGLPEQPTPFIPHEPEGPPLSGTCFPNGEDEPSVLELIEGN